MGYQLIETIEVPSGGATSIEFTGIPQDGVDLVLIYSGRNTGASAPYLQMSLAGTQVITMRYLEGNGSSASSGNFTQLANDNISTDTANSFSNMTFYISNYTSTVVKSVSVDAVSENNGTTAYQRITAASAALTSGVTSMSFYHTDGNHAQYSTASLYKITAD
jgi:hypothetical protein